MNDYMKSWHHDFDIGFNDAANGLPLPTKYLLHRNNEALTMGWYACKLIDVEHDVVQSLVSDALTAQGSDPQLLDVLARWYDELQKGRALVS